jgi:hypothetical protein
MPATKLEDARRPENTRRDAAPAIVGFCGVASPLAKMAAA